MINRSKKFRKRKGKRRPKIKLEPLYPLVGFLNAQTGEEIQNWSKCVWRSDWLKNPLRYRQEVINDLQPLIENKDTESENAALDALTEKLKGLKLSVAWEKWSAKPTFGVYSKKKRVSVKNPIWPRLGTAQGKYRDWLISRELNDGGHPRQFLYGLIGSALQSGALEHLGRCQREGCGNFFVKGRGQRKYCGRTCSDAVARAKAKERASSP